MVGLNVPRALYDGLDTDDASLSNEAGCQSLDVTSLSLRTHLNSSVVWPQWPSGLEADTETNV